MSNTLDPKWIGTNTAEEARQYIVYIQETLDSDRFRQSVDTMLNRVMARQPDDRMDAFFVYGLCSAAMQARALSDTLRSIS